MQMLANLKFVEIYCSDRWFKARKKIQSDAEDACTRRVISVLALPGGLGGWTPPVICPTPPVICPTPPGGLNPPK